MSTLRERFESKYIVGDDGCWHWTGGLHQNGYGQFRISPKKNGYAHRAAYEIYVGPIPRGMTIDHLCGVKTCVNPEHLEISSWAKNHKRWSESVTHCKRGHEFTEENTRITPDGKRVCKACIKEHQRKWRENHREHHNAYHRERYRRLAKERSGREIRPYKKTDPPPAQGV